MLYNVSVNDGVFMYGNLCAYGSDNDGLMFVSAFGNSTVVQQAVRDLQTRKCTVRVHWSYYVVEAKSMEVISAKMQDSDYSHILMYKKDGQYGGVDRDWNGVECLRFYSYLEIPEGVSFGDIYNMARLKEYPQELVDSAYDKLLKLSPIPVIKEWVPYILSNATMSEHFKEANIYNSNDRQNFKCYYLDIPIIDLQRMLQSALRNKAIEIDGATTSDFMREIQGLDAYLSEFSVELTNKIQSSFVPRFIPGEDQYSIDLKSLSDYMNYSDDISLYPAQKDVAQAVSNTLDNNKCALVIAEMGSGKTSIGIASVVTHFREIEKKLSNKFMINLVMCPSHLVHHWEREITDRAPRSKAIIIKDLNHLIDLMPLLTGKEKRHEHIWLILSKETAKLGYVLRPAAVWRPYKKIPGQRRFGVYCCPSCGQPLFYQTKEGAGRNKRTTYHFLTETSFRAPSIKKNNIRCQNYKQKKVWDSTIGDWKRLTRCDCNLWTISTKEILWSGPDDDPTKWIKLGGSAGWIQRCNAERIQEQILAQDDQTADDLQLLAQLQNIINGEVPVQVAPRKYPISKYIRRYLKSKIDYLILDELHGYKGADSLQGEAAGDLIFAAKHVLGLTGTLLNGYSSGIYYLLFRMFSKKMKSEGYEYGNDMPFIKDYGVTRQTTWFRNHGFGRYDDVSSRGKIKELPGVSPIVFTKFLLENSAFLSLEDITEGLPGYEEIPVALDMPSELADAYADLKQQFDSMLNRSDITAAKCLAQAVQLLSVFPDQPYDQPSVIDPETGNIAIAPPSLTTEYREKETALLDIIEGKIEAGEHILIYYTWTNRSDVAERLTELLTSHGYKIANLTSQVKAVDRETWINKQVANGAQILLCNPSLVETGLTLLDFTTIIYYQYGYNLYTMRQASRRSWRINQDHDVQVYFLYYKDTVQETALALMATKLQAAMAIEGKFSEDGLNAMSNNEDLLTQIAGSVTEGIKDTVDPQVFEKTKIISQRKVEQIRKKTKRGEYKEAPYSPKNRTGFDPAISEFMRSLNL